jgi:hypothetical protein
MTNSMFDLVEIPFYGDSIEAARNTQDGSFYVSIRRVCDNLGIGFSAQLEKLKGYHWATVALIDMVAQDEKRRELAVLPLAQVPGWLTHINPDKVGGGDELVEKLKRYQVEAVDVLYRHFIAAQSAPQDPIVALSQSVIATRQAQLAIESRVDGIQEQVGNMVELQRAALGTFFNVPRATEPPAPLTTRKKISMIVRSFIAAHSINPDGDEYKDMFNNIYWQFKYRYGFDATVRAKNAGISKLEAIERAGLIEELYKLVSELCS